MARYVNERIQHKDMPDIRISPQYKVYVDVTEPINLNELQLLMDELKKVRGPFNFIIDSTIRLNPLKQSDTA